MDTIGLDLHQRESQLCVLTDEGEMIERRIVTRSRRTGGFPLVADSELRALEPSSLSRECPGSAAVRAAA